MQPDLGVLEAERSERLHPDLNRKTDERAPAERDRDRVLYSTAFRRLSRVTQVVSPDERQILHNRLTHSLEVAQVGRGLATRLRNQSSAELIQRAGGIDPYVVEAAALAHDLGHPPFGHVAETELDRIMLDGKFGDTVSDGFEGNAQSFRIVTRLAARYPKVRGLNLCRATLGALLKYPWIRSDSRAKRSRYEKWGAYDSELDELEWARSLIHPSGNLRSIEAAIMDWADDIAYAVSDLEDFIRAGFIPLNLLIGDDSEREEFFRSELEVSRGHSGDALEARKAATNDLLGFAPRRFDGTRIDRAILRGFTSTLINRYIASVSLVDHGPGEQSLLIEPGAKLEVDVLKGLTWHYVIRRNSLSTLRIGQRTVISDLFSIFFEASKSSGDHAVFPRNSLDDLEACESDGQRKRVVADVIASMNESQAIDIHQRLTGRSLGSAMEDLLL